MQLSLIICLLLKQKAEQEDSVFCGKMVCLLRWWIITKILLLFIDSICEWLLVGFYGPQYPSKKKKAWENLMALLEAHHGPWMCFGDFNFVLNENEVFRRQKR